MNYEDWILEIEELVIDEYDEDMWDLWGADEDAWVELYDEDISPEEAIEEYRKINAR